MQEKGKKGFFFFFLHMWIHKITTYVILLLYLLGCHHVCIKACMYLNNVRLCKGVYRHSHVCMYAHKNVSSCVHIPLLFLVCVYRYSLSISMLLMGHKVPLSLDQVEILRFFFLHILTVKIVIFFHQVFIHLLMVCFMG